MRTANDFYYKILQTPVVKGINVSDKRIYELISFD